MKVLTTTSKAFPRVSEMVLSGKLSVDDVLEICIVSRHAEVMLMEYELERLKNDIERKV